jgi:hypothetical protein
MCTIVLLNILVVYTFVLQPRTSIFRYFWYSYSDKIKFFETLRPFMQAKSPTSLPPDLMGLNVP